MPAVLSSTLSPVALMRREMAVRQGLVPVELDGLPVAPGHNRMSRDAFLLREPEVAFLYRRSEGVVVARGPGWTPQLEELYLNGSVCAAVASLNGLLPIHASAVVVEGRVVAFTAPAGGGKSTLAAGLAALGLPLFCDDTLVARVEPDGSLLCLPGHKRMKLWPDAVELTGSTPLEQVSADYAKFYVSTAGSAVDGPLPLGALVFLETGAEPALLPLHGGGKIARLSDDHYTRAMFCQANALDGPALFALQARIARAVPMARFVRSLDRGAFARSTGFLAEALCAMMRG
ncbi:hypothetical protein ACFOD9_12035 [Novosphingobium bradum]|uniref:Serine kinase n=1 Tax=Novosphingobium bradum TaxID=1737444 RepID=A0ABV7IQP1_9SPHN